MKNRIFGILVLLIMIPNAIVYGWSTEDGLHSDASLSDLKDNTEFWLEQTNPLDIDNDSFTVKTHPILTYKIINLFKTINGAQLGKKQVSEIVWGSIEEDWDLEGTSSNSDYSDVKFDDTGIFYGTIDKIKSHNRTVNHFIGPNNEPLNDVLFKGKTSSLNWAKDYIENNYNFSKIHARYREEPAGGWRAVGHILHLLEDCTSPAHVRNDAHVFNKDNYEEKTKKWSPKTHNEWIFSDETYFVPFYNKIDDYFTSLSDYTRTHYFSDNSMFSPDLDLKVNYYDQSLIHPYFYNIKNGVAYKKIAFKGIAFWSAYTYYLKSIPLLAYELAKPFSTIDDEVVEHSFSDIAQHAIHYGAGLLKLCIEHIKEIDSDLDGILNDGDESGDPNDNPCRYGNISGCDDNCPNVYNPDQADSDDDGIGDVCEGSSNLFTDDFNDGDYDGWNFYSFTTGLHGEVVPPQVIDGKVHIYTRDQQLTMLTNGDESWSDYTVEAEVTVERDYDDSGRWFGIEFYSNNYRYSEPYFLRDSFLFWVSGRNRAWVLLHYHGLDYETVASGAINTITNGNPYIMKAAISGDNVDLYLYEKDQPEIKLDSVDISGYGLNSGGFGFGGGDDEITIDNVKVYQTPNDGEEGINRGIVTYYPFSNDAKDASGNGNDGTVYGASFVTDRFGNENSAISFDGVNDYIQFGRSATLDSLTDELTIALWIKRSNNDISEGLPIVKRCYDGADNDMHFTVKTHFRYGIAFEHSGAIGSPYPGYNAILTTPNTYDILNDGDWHLVIITHKYETREKTAIYIDGTKFGIEWEWDIGDLPAVVGDSMLVMGKQHVSSSPGFYNGLLDDVRIYNRVLTESEIQTLYNAQ